MSNFAIYFAGDAYNTSKKIMGRQSAGKAFMRGVARAWPRATLLGLGQGTTAANEMRCQLAGDGYTGELRWAELPDWRGVSEVGSLYYPAPPPRDFAFARSQSKPDAFSLIGVTHTLSSIAAMDQVSDLALPPFEPWDALICTSRAAHGFVSGLQDQIRDWWRSQTGANRFVQVQLPVIPLGVDAPAFVPNTASRAAARKALGLAADETVFLFAGRLSFHAKANPAPMYQALQCAAQKTRVTLIEAGVFPNDAIKHGYAAAQRALAPAVRFLWVDGGEEARYREAWQAADVFVSLSDNIQETFGLTPLEAMAAGLPVVVSDWDGYKDTVRDGIDGFRIPTVLPPAGIGSDLALRHALGLDTYDYYIGRTSLATVVEPNALAAALTRLATDPVLRASMGAAGMARTHKEFDWPIILERYRELADELAAIRKKAGPQRAESWPQRADPFARFRHFPSGTLGGDWRVVARPEAGARLRELLELAMVNYAFDNAILPKTAVIVLLEMAEKQGNQSVNGLLAAGAMATPIGVRALMWLWKFNLISILPNSAQIDSPGIGAGK